eukprot:218844-Chlamydomonas_euryale.AAC.1
MQGSPSWACRGAPAGQACNLQGGDIRTALSPHAVQASREACTGRGARVEAHLATGLRAHCGVQSRTHRAF